MGESSLYRDRLQVEIEGSLRDLLSVLMYGVSGPAAAASANSIHEKFFKMPQELRKAAILDPRVVASLESIQRLLAVHGHAAFSHPDWDISTGVVLRLEVFCAHFLEENVRLEIRESTDHWLSVPGTSLYLRYHHGNDELRFERGSVIGCDVFDARFGEPVSSSDLPFVALSEYALLPPIEGKEICCLSSESGREWGSAISAAIKLVKLHPPSRELVREHVFLLVPLENDRDGYFSSISFNSIPGAVYTSLHTDLMFAETLVHEADHQWLYSFARFEQIWSFPDDAQEPIYRSPWREDPRPIEGLLWGASAFVRVGAMWEAVANALPNSHSSLDWVRKRAVLCNYQAIDALRTVQNYGNLSASGEALLASLARQATETRARVSEMEDYSGVLRWAEGIQHEHDSAWIKRNPLCDQGALPFSSADYLSFERPI